MHSGVSLTSSGHWLKRRPLAASLWIGCFVLGIALITGTLGSTAAGAMPGVHMRPPVVNSRASGKTLQGVHGRLLQQRIGGSPMSPQ